MITNGDKTMVTASEIVNEYSEERRAALAVLSKTQNEIEVKLNKLLAEINQIEDEDTREHLLDEFNDEVYDFAYGAGLEADVGSTVEFWEASTC